MSASVVVEFKTLGRVLHGVRVSSVVVEACDRRGGIQVQLPGHAVQVGQSQVNAAHRDHAGFKKVHVPVIVTGDLGRTGRKRTRLKGFTCISESIKQDRTEFCWNFTAVLRSLPAVAQFQIFRATCHKVCTVTHIPIT